MEIKIVDINTKNFDLIPRPADRRYNCQECFFWMGKWDGKLDLVKQKKKWFVKKAGKYGSLGKLLLWGKRQKPVGYIQFGPISEFETVRIFYQDMAPIPRNGWCITCVAVDTNYRGKGLAKRLIRNVLRDLKRRGVRTVDAYPVKKPKSLNQVPCGPTTLFKELSFESVFKVNTNRKIIRDDNLVVRKKLKQ
ncbi:GNAT family N-acetyltransferase [Patescibacteria group bacterium]|nr:GNAT family N-acetyltransferase [Patescibacteria group bacterium]